jgi:hypothetical protein
MLYCSTVEPAKLGRKNIFNHETYNKIILLEEGV